MSGVKNKVQADTKGLKQVTNADLKRVGTKSPTKAKK